MFLLFSESIYKNLKSSLPVELLEDAIIVKVKHFYQAFIRAIIDKELEQIFFKDSLEVEATEKIGVRSLSTIARILSQIRLKVEPGWVNLINEKAKLKILALVLLTINKRKILLIIEIKGFHKKPNVQELTEILKQFLIKFAELIVSKKSSSFIKVNTPQGTFEIKDLTKEIGKKLAILTKDGKIFRSLPNPNEIANKKLKFISLKGGQFNANYILFG